MTAAHLVLDDVGKAFGAHRALCGSTVVAQGGVTVVVGSNGSGKSTLLRCAATVLDPDTGRVTIDGLDPRREAERIEVRRRLGYAPQEAGFDHRHRVFDAIEVVAVLKGFEDDRRRRRVVHDVLDAMGLADRAVERVGELSGGMRRRLVLAQALLGDPALLILDEPTAGLDPDERERWRRLLDGRRRGTTVLASTHLLDEAAGADAVVVLHEGAVRFVGTPGRLTATATGRVWEQAGFPPPGTVASRPVGGARHRCVGTPPSGAETVEPTIEDGYLLVRHDRG